MTNPDEKDRNSTSPGDTPTTSNSNIKERRHSSSDDGCKPVDGLSASLTKACSMTPIEDISVREGPSTSGLLASSAVENRDESKSENKSRSQNLSSSGLKAASTACANFYKLATSELDSSEDLALPTLNELSSLGTGHNKVSQQPCANQHQLSADRTSSSCYKISSDTRDRQSNGVDKGKKCIANVTTPSENGIHPIHCGLGWQSSKHTVKQRLEHMYLNPYLADVYFVVSNLDNTAKKRIPAHKFVLSIGSPVFDAMFKFDANQEETGHADNAVKEIELIDVEQKALETLLIFLYTDKVSIYPDSVMAVLYSAKKYGIPALEQHCVDFLKYNLSPENAFMLLGQARLFDEPQLMDMCLAVIDRDTNEAIQAEGFTDVDHQTLCSVLKRDSLRIDELPLFQALVKWSMEECKRKYMPITPENQREVLGCIVSLVRYNQMSVQEFAEHVVLSKLLTDSEIVSIFLYFTLNNVGGGPVATAQRLPIPFLVAPRRRFIGKEMSINRFQRIEASWGYSGTPDRIKFTVDAPIFVLGFGLYGSMNDSAEYGVTIEIINFGSGQILAHRETSFMADGTPRIFRVMFKEPVEIASGLTYIASAKLKGAESHYGTKGLRRIVRQLAPAPSGISSSSGTDSAITFQFSFAAGNNNGTSVEDGQIPEIVFCQKF